MTGNNAGKPRITSLREAFPDARLMCVCVEDRDACHSGCSWFREKQKEIREWLGKVG